MSTRDAIARFGTAGTPQLLAVLRWKSMASRDGGPVVRQRLRGRAVRFGRNHGSSSKLGYHSSDRPAGYVGGRLSQRVSGAAG